MKAFGSALLLFFLTSSPSWAQNPSPFWGQLFGNHVSLHFNFDTDTPIVSDGPVALRAQCLSDEGGYSLMRIYATTTLSTGTVLIGSDTFDGGNEDGFLLPGTAIKDAELIKLRTLIGETRWDNYSHQGFLIGTSRLTDTNNVYGFSVNGDSSVLGITDDGCYIDMKLRKVRHFKKARNSQPAQL